MDGTPMITVERGLRGGYGVFADGTLSKASDNAEGALVGVAGLLDVSLLELLRSDAAPARNAVAQISVDHAASCVVSLLYGLNLTHQKIHAIKAIRALTGAGLKDAKDAFEKRLAETEGF